MKNENLKKEGMIGDEKLDQLIRLAFLEKEVLETQELLDSTEKNDADADEMERVRRSAFELFLQKNEENMRAKQREERAERAKRLFPKVMNIVAAVILVLEIAAPIAVARVDTIRMRVINQLVEIGENCTVIPFDEIPQPPGEWRGEYYPMFIPKGFEISFVSEMYNEVEYTDSWGRRICFMECGEGEELCLDSENTTFSKIEFDGHEALLFEKDGHCKLIWGVNGQHFMITAELLTEEAVKIARSVDLIE